MLSIANKVEQMVADSPFLTAGMAAGLINLSALARQLRPQLESDLWKPVGQAAVVMALRRICARLPHTTHTSVAAPATLAPCMGELTSRADLANSTYLLSDNSNACQRRLLALTEPYPGAFVTVTRGVHEMLVVCSRALLHIVEQAFGGERLLSRVDNLTALTLRLNPAARQTPGVYHAVLKRLAWEKINVISVMCTFSELTIVLEQRHTGAACLLLTQSAGH